MLSALLPEQDTRNPDTHANMKARAKDLNSFIIRYLIVSIINQLSQVTPEINDYGDRLNWIYQSPLMDYGNLNQWYPGSSRTSSFYLRNTDF